MLFQTNCVRLIEEGGFTDAFRDKMGNAADGLEGIFPIVHLDDAYPYKPIGTGFFISTNGLFATAKHVLVNQNGSLLNSLAGIYIVRRQNRITIREIIKVALHPIADVAIGFLIDIPFLEKGIQTVNMCFMLTDRIPEIGEKIGTFAYPKPKYAQNDEGFEGEYICQGKTKRANDQFNIGQQLY